MSFLFALVTDHWALVASDTRARWKEYDADDPRDLATLPATRVIDGGSKLVPLVDGWLASGPHETWRTGLRDAVSEAHGLAALTAAVRAFGPPAMARLEQESSAEARDVRQRQSTMLVVRHQGGFAGAALDWAGSPLWPGADCRTVSALCPDVPVETMRGRLHAYQTAVQHERDLRHVVRATAQLFRDVSAETGPEGSVSAEVALGLLNAQGRRLIGPCPHAELLGEEVPC